MGLAQKALETLSFRVLALPLNFVTAVITSRYLLPEGRGAYVLGLLTVSIAGTLLGNGTAVSHEMGRRDEPDQAVVCRSLLISIVVGIAGAAVLVPIGMALIQDYPSAQLVVLSLPALLVVQTIGGGLLARGRLRLFNGVDVLGTVLTVIGMLILVVWLDLGLNGAVAAWIAAQTVSAIVSLAGARDLWSPLPAGRAWRSLRRMWQTIALGFRAGLVSLVSLVNYRVELFLLEAYKGLGAVGVYSISMSLAELLWMLSSTLTVVVVQPAIHGDERRAVSVVTEAVRHCVMLTAFFGVLLGAVGVVGIPLVFGEAFEGAVVPLLILIPGMVAFSVRGPTSIYFSVRLGRMRYPLFVAGTSAAITALLCLVLIPPYGSNGAALATTAGYSIGGLIMLVAYLRSASVSAWQLLPQPADLTAYRELARSLRSRLA